MTRNENGIPQITFAPRAVFQRLGSAPMNFQSSWLPSPTRKAGVISASMITKNAIGAPWNRLRNAIDRVKPSTATIAPAARLIQRDCCPVARTASALEPGIDASKSDRHHTRLAGPLNGKVRLAYAPWKERIAIRIIGT